MMKWICSIIFVCLSITANAEPINLVGKWQGEYRTYVYRDGSINKGYASTTFTVIEQDTAFLRATSQWQNHTSKTVKAEVAGDMVQSATETLLGMFSFDGKEVTFIDTKDNGMFKMKIIDNNTMQAMYIENQHHEATLFRVELKRVK
ncbi:hypothetical protein [uncultured Shewanella sp.]|uniref:hypothetical protein n=1 Tax=uncultured Shewanella sp. TaxID=173975 RepID=UPI00261AC9B0|nr:hypothetical protein [uncultured Shewanella sp.]